MNREKNIRFVFFGTPKFSVDVLHALEAHGLLPALVVTAPDKPRGRGLELSPSLVAQWAHEREIEVVKPEKLTDEHFLAELHNTDWDVFVIAAYNKLLRKEVLDMPRRRCLNVHPSLLPKFRGPSPALSTILADEKITGVSIMQMSEGMDEGPVVAQAKIEFADDTCPPRGSELEELLATEGGNLLAETLPEWIAGNIEAVPQDSALATFSHKFSDEDARIDLERAKTDAPYAREAFLKIRAFDKGPRAYAMIGGKRIILTEAQWKDGQLEILRVIPEGKKEMNWEEFLRMSAK